jgi:TonB family protein
MKRITTRLTIKVASISILLATLSINSYANETATVAVKNPNPVVKIHPKYPIQAARNGTEGFCTINFSINNIGGVENAKIVECQPGDVFAKQALRALVKWKYIPKILNGEPVAQHNLTEIIEFKMN